MAYYFSQEILTEILKRLPIKSLLKFRCVEKSWYYLTCTHHFNTLWSQHQKNYLLFEKSYYDGICFSLRFDDDKGCKECYSTKFPEMRSCPCWSTPWSATSNGLICLSTVPKPYLYDDTCYYYNTVILWNPAIRKFITLPHPPRCSVPKFSYGGQVKLAFGFVHNDYKVVKLIHDRWDSLLLVDVYTLSTHSWKIISQGNIIRPNNIDIDYHKKEVFVNGAAFWLGKNSKYENFIVCFDTYKEVLQKILLPECCERKENTDIRALGDSLALLVIEGFNVFKIWIWTQDAIDHDEGFWKHNITVSLGDNISYKVLGSRNGDELVMLRGSKEYVCYNIQKDEMKDFNVSNLWSSLGITNFWGYTADRITVNTFTETLFLLDTRIRKKSDVSHIYPDVGIEMASIVTMSPNALRNLVVPTTDLEV